jgi:hypothetical protein
MKSTGTARTRIPGHEAQQLHEVDNPVLSPQQSLCEQLERVIVQQETIMMALVPYVYKHQRRPPNRSNITVGLAVLAAVCLWTLALACIVVERPPQLVAYLSSIKARMIHSLSTVQVINKLTDHLANDMASYMGRLNDIDAMETKLSDSLKFSPKAHIKPTAPVGRTPRRPLTSLVISKTSGKPTDTGGPTLRASTSPTPVKRHNEPDQILQLKPTPNALAHRAADSTIDYWLVPRGSANEPTKVLPLQQTADGVVVRCLQDGKNYLLTRDGHWLSKR